MSFELDVQRNYIGLDQLGLQQQNCQQGLGTSWPNPVCVPQQSYIQFCYCSPPRDLHAFRDSNRAAFD